MTVGTLAEKEIPPLSSPIYYSTLRPCVCIDHVVWYSEFFLQVNHPRRGRDLGVKRYHSLISRSRRLISCGLCGISSFLSLTVVNGGVGNEKWEGYLLSDLFGRKQMVTIVCLSHCANPKLMTKCVKFPYIFRSGCNQRIGGSSDMYYCAFLSVGPCLWNLQLAEVSEQSYFWRS